MTMKKYSVKDMAVKKKEEEHLGSSMQVSESIQQRRNESTKEYKKREKSMKVQNKERKKQEKKQAQEAGEAELKTN